MELLTFTSTTSDPAARGAELGTAFARQYRRTAELYLTHFADLGIAAAEVQGIAERSHAALAAWAPGLAAESEAIAAAADVDPWRLAAVGARTEVLAAAPPRAVSECSTAVHVGPGAAPESIQTWDWHDFLVPEALLLALVTASARLVKTTWQYVNDSNSKVNVSGN